MPSVPKKRVLMLLQNYPYPADGRVRAEAVTLASAGYGVSVISPRSPNQRWEEVVDGVNVYRFPAPYRAQGAFGYVWEYGYSIAAIFLLSLRVLFKDGFDIVHAAQPPDALAAIAAFYKLLGKQYVLDHHDLSPELYYYARFAHTANQTVFRLLLSVERLAFRLADRVVSTNESYRQIALERGHIEPSRVAVVRNGPENVRALPEGLMPVIDNHGRTVIGYLGVTGPQDGVDNLLRAVHCLVYKLKREDFLCVIVGSGSAMPALKSLAHELEIESYVWFTGWVRGRDLVAQHLNAMDICVAPEPSDPYNDRSTAVKVMEYMAAGRPVVSFDLPEHRITAGEAALYAKPGDHCELAQKICQLMDDGERREHLGGLGRRRIESELGWSHQAAKLVELYAGLTANKSEA